MSKYEKKHERQYIQADEFADDPILNLALAVVTIAVADYRRAIREGDDLTQYRQFFGSTWFNTLTRDKLDGEVLSAEIERREYDRMKREGRKEKNKNDQY